MSFKRVFVCSDHPCAGLLGFPKGVCGVPESLLHRLYEAASPRQLQHTPPEGNFPLRFAELPLGVGHSAI
jgi:hypothetical protein